MFQAHPQLAYALVAELRRELELVAERAHLSDAARQARRQQHRGQRPPPAP